MAKYIDNGAFYTLRLSANDTYAWANRAGRRWPCSYLSGRSAWAQFDSRTDDVVDTNVPDCPGDEFAAIFDDFRAQLKTPAQPSRPRRG